MAPSPGTQFLLHINKCSKKSSIESEQFRVKFRCVAEKKVTIVMEFAQAALILSGKKLVIFKRKGGFVQMNIYKHRRQRELPTSTSMTLSTFSYFVLSLVLSSA